MDTLSLHSSCENISSYPWSKNKEGASPFPVTCYTFMGQHSWQGQEVLGWDPSMWAWCCISILFSFVVPASAGPSQLQKQLLTAQWFSALLHKQLSCLPSGAGNAGGRAGTTVAPFSVCLWMPKGLDYHLSLPYLYVNIMHHTSLFLCSCEFQTIFYIKIVQSHWSVGTN